MHPDDYPPPLHWETPVWWLYQRMQTQFRYRNDPTSHASVVCGIDYAPAIALMQSLGWPLDLGLELLQVVEVEALLRSD